MTRGLSRSTRFSSRDVRLPAVLLALGGAVTTALMVAAAMLGRADLLTFGATLFAGLALLAILLTVKAGGQVRSSIRGPMAGWGRIRHLTRLAIVVYGWGAITMQALYLTPITGLKWQHGWQYALAMALLAGFSALVFRGLWPPPVPGQANDPTLARLRFVPPIAALQALAAAGALGWLVLSDKLASERADWAANRVFAPLAVAVVALSVAAVLAGRGARTDTA